MKSRGNGEDEKRRTRGSISNARYNQRNKEKDETPLGMECMEKRGNFSANVLHQKNLWRSKTFGVTRIMVRSTILMVEYEEKKKKYIEKIWGGWGSGP